jgi:hypothetical protein
MTSSATNRLAEALGGTSAADAAAQMQVQPGVALFFGLLLVAGLVLGAAAMAWMIVRRPRTDLLVARPWGAHDALRLSAVLLVLLGAYLSGIVLVQKVRPDLAATEAFAATATAAQSAVFHWPILVFAGLRMARDGTSLRTAFGIEARRVPAHAGLGAALYPAALPAVAVAAFVAQWGIRRFGIDAGPQEVLRLMMDRGAGAMRYYLIALAVAIAPVAEEILFRGIVLPVLARHTGTLWALVASAAVFAALHMNLAAAAPLFILGLVLGLAYLYSGSLTVSIALHAVFNSVSIAVSHLLPTVGG